MNPKKNPIVQGQAISVAPLKDFPKLGAKVKPANSKAELIADDGTAFLASTTLLSKASEVLKDTLSVPANDDASSVPRLPLIGISTAAVAFFATFIKSPDAYNDPPLLNLGSNSDAILSDLLRLQDMYELKAQSFFQAVIRRLELDHHHVMAQNIVVFAAIGNFPAVVARYSTFLLSPTSRFQYHQPKYWWSRTLKDKCPVIFEEVQHMYNRWDSEFDSFIGTCTYEDFKFSSMCSSEPCPTFNFHHGSEAAYYINMAMCIWGVIEDYPQCVCLEVLLVAIQASYPDHFCKTCATTMADAFLRHYDWCISPASWRMGNLSRNLDDMLFDYMSWTVTGKATVASMV